VSEAEFVAYGLIAREYVNLGEGPYKNVIRAAVSQARLAEPIRVLSQRDGWYEIEQSDTYRGWVSPTDVVLVTKAYWDEYQQSEMVLITHHFVYIYPENDLDPSGKDASTITSGATLGTMLKLVNQESSAYKVELPDGKIGYLPLEQGQIIPRFNKIARGNADSIIALAKEFIGLPYYWAGTTPYGYDCSGFIQTIFKMNGIHLLRDADQQYEQGEEIATRDRLIKGDVVFWSTYKPGASHVGIYIGNNEYIHSGGANGVWINSFDPTQPNYSEKHDTSYIGARRFL